MYSEYCKYCENPNMEGFNSDFEMKNGTLITMDILGREIYVEFESESVLHEDSVDIGYCPMCGRRL